MSFRTEGYRDAGKTVFIDEQHHMKIFIFIMPIVCTSMHVLNRYQQTYTIVVLNTFARRVYFPCARRIPPQFRVVIHNKQFKFLHNEFISNIELRFFRIFDAANRLTAKRLRKPTRYSFYRYTK